MHCFILCWINSDWILLTRGQYLHSSYNTLVSWRCPRAAILHLWSPYDIQHVWRRVHDAVRLTALYIQNQHVSFGGRLSCQKMKILTKIRQQVHTVFHSKAYYISECSEKKKTAVQIMAWLSTAVGHSSLLGWYDVSKWLYDPVYLLSSIIRQIHVDLDFNWTGDTNKNKK